jgi:hypothetical protein
MKLLLSLALLLHISRCLTALISLYLLYLFHIFQPWFGYYEFGQLAIQYSILLSSCFSAGPASGIQDSFCSCSSLLSFKPFSPVFRIVFIETSHSVLHEPFMFCSKGPMEIVFSFLILFSFELYCICYKILYIGFCSLFMAGPDNRCVAKRYMSFAPYFFSKMRLLLQCSCIYHAHTMITVLSFTSPMYFPLFTIHARLLYQLCYGCM